MFRRRVLFALFVLGAVFVAGCVGGGGSSSSSLQHEMDSFFSRYAYWIKSEDLNSLVDMYQLPVKFSTDKVELTIKDTATLAEILAGNYGIPDPYSSIEVEGIIKSVAGNASNAVVKYALVIDKEAEHARRVLTYDLEFTLSKTSEGWRIREEYWADHTNEYTPYPV